MAGFLARASACSLPIIPAWDFNLKKWMGDGDWQIAWIVGHLLGCGAWRWRFGCESCFLIWCSDVRLSVAICDE